MNILMIEDNESVSEMMQMFFLNEGWKLPLKMMVKKDWRLFLLRQKMGHDYVRLKLT